MKKILITGFEPFDKEKINPSEEILKQIDQELYPCHIHTRLLPVTVNEAGEMVKEAIESIQPDYLLSLGLSGRISQIALERIAVNLVDARIPDNNGDQPEDMIINTQGPVAYWSSLPIRTLEKNLKAKGLPIYLSYSAGTYICNYVMYTALDYIEEKELKTKSGFIHVPFLPVQCLEHPLRSSMDLNLLMKMINTVIDTFLNEP
ncbi:MAG TPA: pyroglutamyl-peptidase I [Thermotogota bacterium]|nr:pyroglutamyl-peptidase I [Thermotogota bacterium]HRW34494.1 pyroglutamyl-peptidase I [Thermotogota bacterium]